MICLGKMYYAKCKNHTRDILSANGMRVVERKIVISKSFYSENFATENVRFE